jgi:tetratricopeptide (TPR) repeat protein
MKSRNKLLLVILLGLQGCVSTKVATQFDPEDYAMLLEQRQFNQARSQLRSATPIELSGEQRQQYARQLDMASELYLQDLLGSALAQERQQLWYAAGQLYAEGLDALPQNAALEQARNDYLRRQLAYVDGIKQNLKLHHGEMLPREVELTRMLSDVYPRDERLRNKLYDMKREAADLVVFMTPLAQDAYDRGQYQLAKQYDRQILQLGESQQSRERIAFVDAKSSLDARRRAQGRQKANKKKRGELWRDYDQALKRGDYLQARAALNKLEGLGYSGPEAQEEHGRLNGLIGEQSAALIAEGKKFYTRGRLDSAIESWRQALVLIPDNQDLVSRIKRAETFQANYQRLSQ